MKGEILKTGSLLIFRPRGKGLMGKACLCIRDNHLNCGDHCPAFGEPDYSDLDYDTVKLKLCFGEIVFESLEDGREE